MVTVSLNGTDITGMVTSIEHSGSTEEVARKCGISYINAPYDPVVKSLPVPRLGDYVSVVDDGTEVFYGRINGAEKSSSYGTVTANCVQDSNLLAKNKCKYNFSEPTTPEGIAEMILNDYEFPIGSIAATGVEIVSMVINGDSIADAIAKAYLKATEKTGKKYRICMEGRALSIAEQGEQAAVIVLSEDRNITESHYSENSDNLVNRVVLYDEKGNRVGEVTNDDSMAAYGTYTEITTTDINVDAETKAESLLQDPEQSLSVTALGDNSCVAGKAIQLMDSATGMYGKYWIKSDKHTYQNNIHTMQLELSFKELG